MLEPQLKLINKLKLILLDNISYHANVNPDSADSHDALVFGANLYYDVEQDQPALLLALMAAPKEGKTEMKEENQAQQEVAAWLHEDGSRSITAAEKRSMLENQGVPGKRVAALYNIRLGRLENQTKPAAAAPAVPLPPTPLPVLRHPELGELFDRFHLHQYAVRYADQTWAAAQSPSGARAIVFVVGDDGVRIELARQKNGTELWAVRDRVGNCLRLDGHWVIEPTPSSRDDAFFASSRFPAVDAAIAAAVAATGS